MCVDFNMSKWLTGWGADEKAIIKIIGHRNAAQKRQIRQAYEQLYQEDLVKRLESELSGDLEVNSFHFSSYN